MIFIHLPLSQTHSFLTPSPLKRKSTPPVTNSQFIDTFPPEAEVECPRCPQFYSVGLDIIKVLLSGSFVRKVWELPI